VGQLYGKERRLLRPLMLMLIVAHALLRAAFTRVNALRVDTRR
jgi:hypothetical protein